MKSFVNEPRIARYEIFPPGHYYHGGPGTVNGFVRWYAPSWMMDVDVIPTKPADLELIRTTLVESVVKRLMADVPYGVLLSGGLDSSLVTSIAVRTLMWAFACRNACRAMRVRVCCCARIGRAVRRARARGSMVDAARVRVCAALQVRHGKLATNALSWSDKARSFACPCACMHAHARICTRIPAQPFVHAMLARRRHAHRTHARTALTHTRARAPPHMHTHTHLQTKNRCSPSASASRARPTW
jgi:hypothetical protein